MQTDPGQYVNNCYGAFQLPIFEFMCGKSTNILRDPLNGQVIVRGVDVLQIDYRYSKDTSIGNSTIQIATSKFTLNAWWVQNILFVLFTSCIVYQLQFLMSWRKVRARKLTIRVFGVKMGCKYYFFMALLALFVIYDDWRFLFISEFESYTLLYLYCLTNLVTVCFVFANILCMNRLSLGKLYNKEVD